MKFSEFFAGQTLEFGEYVVMQEEVIEFAVKYDPQPFHIDKAAAERSRWGGLIASGFQTCGIAMALMTRHVLLGSESMGSPGLEYVKWPNPVRPADRLRMSVQVHEVRRSRSGRVGIVRWQWLLLNQHDALVLDLSATSLFTLESPQA